ncbi:MAG TPA: WD40 repeat domain-containing protein, partial [Candidatus Obscuribacterales bacterium]|nr:WD40 repeat domain-containing protein [Candidatus Obscuribacterales bacterium]
MISTRWTNKRRSATYVFLASTMTLLPALQAMAAGNSLAWETFYDLGNRLLKSGELQDAEKQLTLCMKEAQLFGPQDEHVLKTLRLMSQLYKLQKRTAEEESINKVIADMESKLGVKPIATASAVAEKPKPEWMVPTGDAAKPDAASNKGETASQNSSSYSAAAAPGAAGTTSTASSEPPVATYPAPTMATPGADGSATATTSGAAASAATAATASSAEPAPTAVSQPPAASETKIDTDTTSSYDSPSTSSAPTKTATELKQMNGHINWVKSIVVSKDGTKAVSGGADNSVRLWDVTQGKQIRMYPGHTNQVNCVAFTPDEKYIVSGSDDCTVRVFEVESGNQVACFRGYTNLITSVDVSADGKRAITGSYDRTARVLSLPDAKEVMTLVGHAQPVRCVAFLSNNKAVTGSDDGVLKIW